MSKQQMHNQNFIQSPHLTQINFEIAPISKSKTRPPWRLTAQQAWVYTFAGGAPEPFCFKHALILKYFLKHFAFGSCDFKLLSLWLFENIKTNGTELAKERLAEILVEVEYIKTLVKNSLKGQAETINNEE